MDVSDYFSEAYSLARDKFVHASDRLRITSHVTARDQGIELAIDLAVQEAVKSGRNLLFVSSGVHGIEGFVGSAVQQMILRDFLHRFNDYTTVALIHALNPYGFYKRRRVNEHGVDLNRNFLDHPADFGVDDKKQEKVSDALQDMLAPQRKRTSEIHELSKFGLHFIDALRKFGYSAAQNAIAGGQYKHPNGLFYGGRQPEKSVAIFRSIIEGLAQGYENVVFIDLHTGFGTNGSDSYITLARADSQGFRRLQKIFPNLQSASHSLGRGEIYRVKGSASEYAANHSKSGSFYDIALDFNTIHPLFILYRMIAENQVNSHGATDEIRERVNRQFMESFFPSDPKWRAQAIENSRDLIEKIGAEFDLIKK